MIDPVRTTHDSLLTYEIAKARWGDVPLTLEFTAWEDGKYAARVIHEFGAGPHTHGEAQLVVFEDNTVEERVVYVTPAGGESVRYRKELSEVAFRA